MKNEKSKIKKNRPIKDRISKSSKIKIHTPNLSSDVDELGSSNEFVIYQD